MNCKLIADNLQWIRTAALDASTRLEDGDSTRLRRALTRIKTTLAEIEDELNGAVLDGGNDVK